MTIETINAVRGELDKLIEESEGDLSNVKVEEKSRQLDKLVVLFQKWELGRV